MRRDAVEQIGSGFHIALRKSCDSTMTTLAYRMINQLTFGWTWLIEQLYDRREEIRIGYDGCNMTPSPVHRLVVLMKKIMTELESVLLEERRQDAWFDGEPIKSKVKQREFYDLMTLFFIFEHFAAEEWEVCLQWAELVKQEEEG